MLDVTLRPATAADAEAVSALLVGLAPLFLPDPTDPATAPFFASITPEAIRDRLTDPRYRYHVAEDGGALIGVVGVRDGAHLYHLFVAEAYHGRRLGARLWATARAEAEAADTPDRFTVNASLNAVPVYARFGFEATGAAERMHGVAFLPMALDRRKAL